MRRSGMRRDERQRGGGRRGAMRRGEMRRGDGRGREVDRVLLLGCCWALACCGSVIAKWLAGFDGAAESCAAESVPGGRPGGS